MKKTKEGTLGKSIFFVSHTHAFRKRLFAAEGHKPTKPSTLRTFSIPGSVVSRVRNVTFDPKHG